MDKLIDLAGLSRFLEQCKNIFIRKPKKYTKNTSWCFGPCEGHIYRIIVNDPLSSPSSIIVSFTRWGECNAVYETVGNSNIELYKDSENVLIVRNYNTITATYNSVTDITTGNQMALQNYRGSLYPSFPSNYRIDIKPASQESEIFWATYGTTTAAEITTAVNAGKEVLCAYNNKTYRFANISDTDIIFAVSVTDTTYCIYVNKTTNVWWYMSFQSELVARKKTSWGTTPLDTNYPSEKLVKNSLDEKYTKPATGIPASDLSDAVKYADELGIPITLDEQSETTAYVLPADFNNIFTYKPRIITVTLPWEGQSLSFLKITEMPNYDQQDHSILLYGVSTGDTNIVLQIAENAPTVDGKRQVSVETMEVENISHKVTTISSSSDDMQYPSAKCVYDAIQASNTPEIFWATYGTTTASEIASAVTAGKVIMCTRVSSGATSTYRLTVEDSNYYWFVYGQTSTISWAYLRKSDDLWVSGNVNAEQTTNKVTSWQQTPSDSKYPSEKLVKDSLDAKVNSASLATVATSGNYSDLTNIPSASIIGEEISPASQELPAVMQLEDSSGSAIEPYCPGLEEWIGEKANLNGDTTQNFRAKSLRFRENPMTGQYSAIGYNTTINRPTLTDSYTTIIAEPIALQDDIPTISTNIVSDKASDAKTASPKAVYDEIHPTTGSAQPSGGFLPNILYSLGTLSGNTTFALATPADANVVNHYYWTFDTGSTAPTITWPTGLTWFGGSAPYIDASKHYEISVLNGIGVAMEV